MRDFGAWLLVAQGVRELRREFKRPTVVSAMRDRFVAIVQSVRRRDITLSVDSANIAVTGVSAALLVDK